MARVRNVVAVLPGHRPDRPAVPHGAPRLRGDRARAPPTTPPGVSALLESVRALTAGPPLRNDVVVVLTDAEEACLCGAEAFAASHPLAADGGVVLNFEARGTSGPPIMFETSRGQRRPRRAPTPPPRRTRWPAASPSRSTGRCPTTPTSACCSPTATSPASTPPSSTARPAYHTPQDVPARLDQGTLQAHGRQRPGAWPASSATATSAPLAEPGARGRDVLPGARRAGALPRTAGVAARPARRWSPSASWSLVAAPARD